MDASTKSAIQTIASEKTKNGWKQHIIINHIKERFPSVSLVAIQAVCKNVKNNVETAYSLEKDYVVGQHLERYNEQIHDLIAGLEDLIMSEMADMKVFVVLFENCLKTLFQKERLVGFHSNKFKIIINNIYKKVEISKKTDKNFNLENLTFEEQIKLSLLLDKARNEGR